MRKAIGNKGFSFVELIVAIGIIAIVGGSLISFLVTGADSYSAVTADTELQEEAQLVLNQISDLGIDTDRAVNFEAGKLTVYNDDDKYEIYAEGGNLYLNSYKRDDMERMYPKFDAVSLKELMATDVTGFEADTSGVAAHNMLTVSIVFEKYGKSYTKVETFSLRNKVEVSSNESVIYKDELIPLAEISRVELTVSGGNPDDDRNYSVWAGERLNVQASVKRLDGTDGGSVIWELTGGNADTKLLTAAGGEVASGAEANDIVLQIAANETSDELNLKATSKFAPARSKSMTVKLKKIAVNIKAEDGGELEDTDISLGGEYRFKAVVEALNGKLDASDTDVEWSAVSAELADTTVEADGVIRVKPKRNGTLTLTAAAKKKASVRASRDFFVKDSLIAGIEFTGEDSSLTKVVNYATYTLEAGVTGTGLDDDDQDIIWTIIKGAERISETDDDDDDGEEFKFRVLGDASEVEIEARAKNDASRRIVFKAAAEMPAITIKTEEVAGFALSAAAGYGLDSGELLRNSYNKLRATTNISTESYDSASEKRGFEIEWEAVRAGGGTFAGLNLLDNEGYTARVEAKSSIGFNTSVRIEVTATLKAGGESIASNTVTYEIKPVKLTFYRDAGRTSIIKNGNPHKAKIGRTDTVYYRLQGIKYEDDDFEWTDYMSVTIVEGADYGEFNVTGNYMEYNEKSATLMYNGIILSDTLKYTVDW